MLVNFAAIIVIGKLEHILTFHKQTMLTSCHGNAFIIIRHLWGIHWSPLDVKNAIAKGCFAVTAARMPCCIRIVSWWPHNYWPFVRGIRQWLVDSPRTGPVMRSLDVSFVDLSKLLTKQHSCLWLGTPWRSCDVTLMFFRWLIRHRLQCCSREKSARLLLRGMVHLECTLCCAYYRLGHRHFGWGKR